MATVSRTPEEQEAQDELRATRVSPVREPRYGQPFFPAVPFGSAFFILATAIALVFLAITNPAPLEHPADPLNHEHINPRPEWYFLFLFQILKIFQGPFELIGTLVIPGLIGLILLGLPFYDRNWSRRAVRRPVAVSLACLSIVGLALLTYIPIESTVTPTNNNLLASVSANPKFVNIQAIFAKSCTPCHISNQPPLAGLDLNTYAGLMKGGSISAGGVVNGAVIKPGDAAGSYLYQAITGKQKVGSSMPFGQPLISKVDQQNIFNWIQNGAKNQ